MKNLLQDVLLKMTIELRERVKLARFDYKCPDLSKICLNPEYSCFGFSYGILLYMGAGRTCMDLK